MRCDDYPCCGHTDGLGCNWTYTPERRAYDEAHVFCEHYAGFCVLDDENEDCEDEDYYDDPEDRHLDMMMGE